MVDRLRVREKTVARSDLSFCVFDMYLATEGCMIIIWPPTLSVVVMPLLVHGVVLAKRIVDCGMTDMICLLYDLFDAATC